MPNPQWVFKPQQPGDTTRDPISGEFFATEAIRNSAEALVREGIQNSLDAGESEGVVRVLIHLAEDPGASAAEVAPFVMGLRDHATASGNGLRPENRPEFSSPCRFLVFEDFGTRGLEGDPEQWHKVDGVRNKFYAFFRAEGESDKSEGDRRGRWGVGKFVFPRASLGSTFFGFTVQADSGRRLLLGRSILKSHQVGDTRHGPDGYYGLVRELSGGRLIVPVEESGLLEQFCRTFNLRRKREPGLSIVVAWYDPEITGEKIVEAAVRDWFFSINSGDLEIEITAKGAEWKLNKHSLPSTLASLGALAREELEPMLVLSSFALSSEGQDSIVLGAADTTGAPKWADAMLNEESVHRIRQRLDSGNPVAVRIPITVRPKGSPEAPSYLDIYLMRDGSADDGRPVFVREGVIVTDAKGGRARGFRSIVNITNAPLATLLGDAENPSHTEWRSDTANFKDRYKFGPGYLTFVKNCVSELMARVQANEDDTAPELLLDIFSLPREAGPERRRAAKESASHGDGPEPPPEPPPTGEERPYELKKREGGFTVARSSSNAPVPEELEIAVAYDVRRGNPFKKYDNADFQLLKRPVVISEEPRGLARIENTGNTIRLKVTDPDFSITFAGFDTHRDLIVRVIAKGTFNDNAAA